MHSAGDDLISIPADDAASAQQLATHLKASGLWLEVVAGVHSVVVQFDCVSVSHETALKALAEALEEDRSTTHSASPAVEIPVVYGGEAGPDFDYVCEKLGLTASELLALHTGEYTVDMLGFTPGFAYIGGLDERLLIDRLEHPRQHVPAGSVGIAGGRTGLYSLSGPGGWPLIGRTAMPLFDPNKEDPFTLAAGARVIFTAVDDS